MATNTPGQSWLAIAEDDGGCLHPFRASYTSCGEEEYTLAAAQMQTWVIYQGDKNMAIVIRLGVAYRASPYYRHRDGFGIETVEWQLRAKADIYVATHGTL